MTDLNVPFKEGIQILRYHDTDYINSPSTTARIINLEGANYLTILCTGAINPFANLPSWTAGYTPESDLYIKFSDKNFLWIDQEMYNIPVDDKDWGEINFQAHSLSGSDFQGFYGDLLLILSVKPLSRFPICKESPYRSETNISVVGGAKHEYRWFGVNRPSTPTGIITAIPYIPAGNWKVGYWVYTTATSFAFILKGYPHNFGDASQTIFNVSANGTGIVEIGGGTRFLLDMLNNDAGSKFFYYQLVFFNRSLS